MIAVIEVNVCYKFQSQEWHGTGYWTLDRLPIPQEQPVWWADVWYAFAGSWQKTPNTTGSFNAHTIAYLSLEPSQLVNAAEEFYRRGLDKEADCSPERVSWTKMMTDEIPF